MTNKDDFKGEIIRDDVFKEIIDKIIETRITHGKVKHMLNLVFHGGEVLIVGHKKFYNFAEYATQQFQKYGLEYTIGMQTNATLLDDEYAKIINKFGINVGLSFDGINDANSERTDIKQSVFENKFETLQENHIDYGFIVVAGKHNIDSMGETTKYLESLDSVSAYKINYAEDMFNPGKDSAVEVEGDEFFEKVFKPEIDKIIKTGNTYEKHTEELLGRSIIDILTNYRNDQKSGCGTLFCGSTTHMIGVNPDGTSHYCDRYDKEYDDTFVMNVLDYDFLGIQQLKRATDFNLSRHNVTQAVGCDTCYARNICEGGCMAFYRSKFGIDGIDERIVCKMNKSFYSYVLKNIIPIVGAYADFNKKIFTSNTILSKKEHMSNKMDRENIALKIDKIDNVETSIGFERFKNGN